MAPSCSPWGRGLSCSGFGNTGLTLLSISTAFLNWVYTSGSLTANMRKCLGLWATQTFSPRRPISSLTWTCGEMEDHLCGTVWTPSRCEHGPSSVHRHPSLVSPHSILLMLPGWWSHEAKNVKITTKCHKVAITTDGERLLNYLFMESHSADRAQLLDKINNHFLWLTLSHYKVADRRERRRRKTN